MLPPLSSKTVGLAAFAAALSSGVVAAKTAWVEQVSLRPARVEPQTKSGPLGAFPQEEVSFTSADGVRLAATRVPSKNGAYVALFHGYGGNREQLAPEAALLASRGYGVLLVDSRAHGRSGGEVTTHGDRERLDVKAALDFLVAEAQGVVPPLGVFGFSAGAVPLPAVVAEDPRVKAIVLAGSPTSAADFAEDESGALAWFKAPIILGVMRHAGIDPDVIRPVDAVARLAPRPLLVVHGALDPIVPVARAQALYAAASEPKRLVVFDNVGHGGFAEAEPERYASLLTEFFDRHLLGRVASSTAPPREGHAPGAPRGPQAESRTERESSL